MTEPGGAAIMPHLPMSSLRAFLNGQFEALHLRSLKFLERLPEDKIFWKPRAEGFETYSAGELLIRSAASVEQTFGGITRRLWDDPFEWTLPEELSGRDAIRDYFIEVRKARSDGFAFFRDDTELYRLIPAPEVLKPIIEILLSTIDRAAHFEGRAQGAAQQVLPIRPDFR